MLTKVYKHRVSIPSLTVIQLSDLHFEDTFQKFNHELQFNCIDRVVEQISKSVKPVVIVVTGDIVDKKITPIVEESIKIFFSCMIATIKGHNLLSKFKGIYCVPGNHDYIDDVEKLRGIIDRIKYCKFLTDEVVEIKGCKVILYGSHAPCYGKRDFRKSTKVTLGEYKDHYKIVAIHNPSAFELAPIKYEFLFYDLALCGHTHGGQIPFPELFVRLPVSVKQIFTSYRGHFSKFQKGLYKPFSYSPLKLIVSSGLGTHPPRRFLQPPSINVIY